MRDIRLLGLMQIMGRNNHDQIYNQWKVVTKKGADEGNMRIKIQNNFKVRIGKEGKNIAGNSYSKRIKETNTAGGS